MSNTEFNTGVHGAGNWAPGTTVREIEGHFHKENEPQGAAPISETGGVPNVDYSTKDKIKDAVTGHSHGSGSHSGAGIGSSSTGSGLTGSHGSSTGSGLTGSSAVGTGSSGLSGNHPGTSDGATHGISDVASRDLNNHSSSSSTGLGATGHSGQQGHGLGTTTATGTGAPNSRVGDSSNSGSLADKAKSAVSGSTNSSGRTDADTNTASGKAQQVGQQGFNKATGADGAHSHAPEEKFGAGGHHGSTDSPTGVHGSTAPHKEGVLEKIKHAISGDKK